MKLQTRMTKEELLECWHEVYTRNLGFSQGMLWSELGGRGEQRGHTGKTKYHFLAKQCDSWRHPKAFEMNANPRLTGGAGYHPLPRISGESRRSTWGHSNILDYNRSPR